MARDHAGNAEAAPQAADLTKALPACDVTPPRTTATVPSGAVSGRYGGPVDVRLDAVDAPGGGGVTALRWAAGGAPTTVQSNATTVRVGGEGVVDLVFAARDAAGNVETDAHLPIRIDTSAPVITATGDAVYDAGQAAAPGVTCADAGVGVASCDFPAALDTSAPGTFSFTVNASDELGHTSSVTRSYTVVPSTNAGPPGGAGDGDGGGVAPPPPAMTFGKAPVKVKLAKVSKRAVALTLTSAERFAFTGKATLLTAGRKPKAQSGAASFSLAAGKSGKLTLKLNAAGRKALKGGKKVELVLRLALTSGATKKTVEVKLTVRAAR